MGRRVGGERFKELIMKQAICGRLEPTAASSRSAGPIAWLYEAALDILKGLAACRRWHICATLLDSRVGRACRRSLLPRVRRRSVGSAGPAAHNQTPGPDTSWPCKLPVALAVLQNLLEGLVLPSDCRASRPRLELLSPAVKNLRIERSWQPVWREVFLLGAWIWTLLSPCRENATNHWETDLIMFAFFFLFFFSPQSFHSLEGFHQSLLLQTAALHHAFFPLFFPPNLLSGMTFQVVPKTCCKAVFFFFCSLHWVDSCQSPFKDFSSQTLGIESISAKARGFLFKMLH